MNLSAEQEAAILKGRGVVSVTERGAKPLEPEPLDDVRLEKDFQNQVIALAKKNAWKVFHCRDSRKSDGPGFPDIVAARLSRVLFIELKTATGKTTAEQLNWGEVLSAVGGNVEYYLFRPENWPNIVAILEKS